MILLRKTIAIGALLTLGALIVGLERGAYGVNPGLVVATKVLLIPLGIAIVGLVLEKHWGRWMGLAAAVAVLPWAIYLTFGLPPGVPLMQQTVALVASASLLLVLTGRAMFGRYEGRAATDWSGPRMGLVRWTLILNLASAVGLFVFVSVYRYRIDWHVAVPAVLLAGLVAGVLLLAKQKTVGLLLVALCCVLFIPAGAFFVWVESSWAGGARIFAASFLPGVLAGWACLIVFGKPVWRTLRSG
jgi:hypothetical protein